MPKPNKTAKIRRGDELIYSTDQLYRWNLCQKTMRALYKSDVSVEQIECVLNDIEEFFSTVKEK